MKTKVVNSEDPKEHWNDITNIENATILDLGCGWLFQPFESTPEFFINNKASKVIGVDCAGGEIAKLNETYPDHVFICKEINEANDLIDLINLYQPDIIKMDIEGYEILLKDITQDQFKSVKQVAIEYHNNECKQVLCSKLPELGFLITNINQFGWYVTDIEQMGIIHARRHD